VNWKGRALPIYCCVFVPAKIEQRLCLALAGAYLVCGGLGTLPDVKADAERLFRQRTAGEKDPAPRYGSILVARKAISYPDYFPAHAFDRVFSVLAQPRAGP
jgi:hypothetical protein